MLAMNLQLFHKPSLYMKTYREKKKAESGGNGKTASIANGFNGQWHGISVTAHGETTTLFFDGKGHMQSQIGGIPSPVPGGRTSADVVRINKEKGYKVEIITPAQYNKKEEARKADREARANIDYELGVGVPWGNSEYRKTARRNRMINRAQKKNRRW